MTRSHTWEKWELKFKCQLGYTVEHGNRLTKDEGDCIIFESDINRGIG